MTEALHTERLGFVGPHQYVLLIANFMLLVLLYE